MEVNKYTESVHNVDRHVHSVKWKHVGRLLDYLLKGSEDVVDKLRESLTITGDSHVAKEYLQQPGPEQQGAAAENVPGEHNRCKVMYSEMALAIVYKTVLQFCDACHFLCGHLYVNTVQLAQ